MAENNLCGICTNVEEETSFKANIFEPNQPQLICQIEKLIGKRVLPQHICIICEEQTQTQPNFATQIKKKSKFSEVQGSEELASNEIHLFKEEQENDNKEDSGVLPSPLPLLTHIILKDEPLSPGGNFNTEYHDEPLLKEELGFKEKHLIKEEQESNIKEDSGVLPSPLPLLTHIILKDEPLSPGGNFNTEYHDEPLLKEELSFKEIHLIKEEQENDIKEDSGVLPSPLPLLTQIILKDEPLSPGGNFNTEYHDEPLLKEELGSKEIHRIKEEKESDNKADSGVLPSPLPLLTQIILKEEPLSPGGNFNTEYHDEPLLKEELGSKEIHRIKEEKESDNKEDSGVLPSPLPLLTQIILKDEPLSPGSNFNTEYHDEPLLKEELGSKEIHRIKEEKESDNKEDSGVLPSPLPLLTQIILKDEPLSPGGNFNTEYHDEPLLKEELGFKEIHFIKEEQENDIKEDSGVLPSPLPLLTHIILKDEPLSPGGNFNKEGHYDSDNSYNSFDQRNSMVRREESTEADGMTLEETNEASFPSYSEVKPPKKNPKSNISKTEKIRQQNSIDSNCELCGKHFTLRGSLWSHMQQHKGEKNFKCDICPGSFFLKTNLKKHKLRHTWEFGCGHCDRRFKQKNDLTRHERIHSKERPCVCPTCGKSFLSLGNLNAHMVIHTGVRAHRCKKCDVAFKIRTNLLIHYRSKKHKENMEKPPINMIS